MNRDGWTDLVARFRLEDVGLAGGDSELCVTGQTTDGGAIEGCVAIEPVPRRDRDRSRADPRRTSRSR